MELLVTSFNFLKWTFIILDSALLIILIISLKNGLKFRPDPGVKTDSRGTTTLSRAVLRERWSEVKRKFEEDTPDALKLAIIEADKLMDHILKESGFEGEHMADRLEKLAPHGLLSFDRLWRAHRLRNEIVHSPGFELHRNLAERTMRDYEAFLKEVNILESNAS